MPRRSPQEILTDLAEMHDLINERTGTVNYSAFSKRTGIPHPTLIRIMQNGPEHSMNSDTVQSLIDAFHITFAQARGDVPIRRKDRRKFELSDADVELMRRLRELPKSDQDDIRKLIELREQLK
jgi:hypothetical protein